MSHQSDLIASDIEAYLKQHERKELLRFLTCGSVDDGKSTLIGRLLHDSKMIYEDQLAALEADSARSGTTGEKVDLALLMDGLKAEREQGITIDVAYRYFSTDKRKFIIADTPGHEQYTRNMVTGASTCNLAIILIDARHGVMPQTKRHSFIASLLGIRHVLVAVNKMDLVDYAEDAFEKIQADYTDFAGRLQIPDIEFIPISALDGDNVVNQSNNMAWYTGPTLMHSLENVHIASDRNLIDMRLPVQYVNRPNLDFRGFAGTLASGVLRPGDPVMALPSRKTSRVKKIVTYDGELDEAVPPQAVTVTLEDEIDVSRGDMLVHPRNQPRVGDTFDAMVVWMAEQPLRVSKQYLIKHGAQATPGVVSDIRYKMDINTLHRVSREGEMDRLSLNEIARCRLKLSRDVAFDPYEKNKTTGAFILIDRMTNVTVGCGMILDRAAEEKGPAARKAEKAAAHVRRHRSLVAEDERAHRLGHKPATVWLTGLTGSGKSAIGYALERRLFDMGAWAFVLDGRNARLGLSVDLDFTDADRAENLRRAAEAARLFNEAGLISICAFLSPGGDDRAAARRIIDAGGAEDEGGGDGGDGRGDGGDASGRFIEVYLSAPPEVADQRRAGAETASKPFFDTQAPYEPPTDPQLTLPTHELGVEACVDRIIALLRQRGVVG